MPAFMKIGDIKGDVEASSSAGTLAYGTAFNGGVRVPTGDDVVVDGRIITAENREGGTPTGDDVIVDGRIITAENWDSAGSAWDDVVVDARIITSSVDPF